MAGPLMAKPVQFVACLSLSFAYITYRAFRGFFVLMPEVFVAVREKLTKGLLESEDEANSDLNPKTGKLKTRR